MRGAIVGVGLCLSLWSSAALAADTWSDPHPGVRMLKRTTNTPWRIFALQIDLCHDGVRMRATKSGERQRTVSSFADLVGADAAVNGDFFSYEDYSTSGLAMGAGAKWSDTVDNGGAGFLAFGQGRAEVSLPAAVVDPPEAWMREIVGGHPKLVADGVAIAEDSGDLCTTRHPRTAGGISADGRTLVLVVVDGRTTASVGMRCTELADLMVELGAATAINLDGGGSSTMWVRGEGVTNDPSDGAQRVVGNHLSLVASGAGEPGSCDRSWEERTLHGEIADASTTTDIDGDGDADLCARDSTGVRCWRADDTEVLGPMLSDATGWNAVDRFTTLRMGDIDGDGDADLCARDATGVRCFASDGTGFTSEIAGPALSDENGWTDPAYHGSLRMADVDGDGRDDLCARAADGLHCWRSTDDGFAEPFVLADLSDAAGFAALNTGGTIRMADIDADGRVDACARTPDGMRCWPSTGTGFGAAIDGPAWSDASGWGRVQYWSTIRLEDVDGDRRADLCARAAAGIRCHLSTGTGFGAEVLGPAWDDDSGWGDYSNYATIRWGDLEGDGDLDLCARANAGIRCYTWDAGAFSTEPIVGPELSDDTGWNSMKFFSTMRMVDIDGDGADEICARSSVGVQCWSAADAFATPVVGPAWSDELGWNAPASYETIRAVTPGTRCLAEESCDNGVDDDCNGDIDDGCDVGTSGGAGDDDGGGSGPGGGDDGSGSDDGNSLPATFGEHEDAEGCGCTTSPPRAAWLVVLVGATAVRRRRRARRRRPASVADRRTA